MRSVSELNAYRCTGCPHVSCPAQPSLCLFDRGYYRGNIGTGLMLKPSATDLWKIQKQSAHTLFLAGLLGHSLSLYHEKLNQEPAVF